METNPDPRERNRIVKILGWTEPLNSNYDLTDPEDREIYDAVSKLSETVKQGG